MHSIVTTFRGAVIKVEVCAAMDTLIDQDVYAHGFIRLHNFMSFGQENIRLFPLMRNNDQWECTENKTYTRHLLAKGNVIHTQALRFGG